MKQKKRFIIFLLRFPLSSNWNIFPLVSKINYCVSYDNLGVFQASYYFLEEEVKEKA